jgi:hypothetical protein
MFKIHIKNTSSNKKTQQILTPFTTFSKKNLNKYVVYIKSAENFIVKDTYNINNRDVFSLQLNINNIVSCILSNSTELFSLSEIVNLCEQHMLLEKNEIPFIKDELLYWHKLHLDSFFPVYDIYSRLNGFVAYSTKKKENNPKSLQNLHSFFENIIKQKYKENYKELINNNLYDRFFNLQKEILNDNLRTQINKIFIFFEEILDASSATLYSKEGNYFVPLKYRNINYVSSINIQDIPMSKVAVIKNNTEDIFYQNSLQSKVFTIKLTDKYLLTYLQQINISHTLNISFLEKATILLEKVLNE